MYTVEVKIAAIFCFDDGREVLSDVDGARWESVSKWKDCMIDQQLDRIKAATVICELVI
jgi:hypothetical protein